MKISNRVFVVTGAGNGMGREVALGLLARGARVAALDVNEAGLAETLRIAGAGVAATSHVVDVTDRNAVDDLVQSVLDVHGHVDALVNIAGIIHRFVPVDELSASETARVMNVNFWGTVNTSLAFLPELKGRPEAALVNMSSLSALIPFAGQTIYGASKGAVKQFTEGLYQELIDTNVTVSAIFPGNISTNISWNSGVKMIDAGGRKVRATAPEAAGASIVEGIECGRFRILVGSDALLLDRLVRIAPKWATGMIARQMKSVM